MRFGLFLGPQSPFAPELTADRNVFADQREEAMLADRLGWDTLWIPEHSFIHLLQGPNTLMAAAHIAAHVQCRVGTMCSLLPYRHPLISAGEAALADCLTDGRLEWGIGRGAFPYEYGKLGIPFEETSERFREAVEIIERVFGEDEHGVSYEGEYTSFEEAYVWPRPIQRPLPIWIASQTLPTIEWASRRGYHVANWPQTRSMDVVDEIASTFHAGREQAGGARGEQKLAILRMSWVTESEEQLERAMDVAMSHYRVARHLHHGTEVIDSRGHAPDTKIPVEQEEYPEPPPQDLYENLLVGTPDVVREKVERYAELGVDELIVWFNFGVPQQDALEALELFARDVMTPFRDAGATHRPVPNA